MSNQSEGDFGQTELDPQEQSEAEVNLDDPTAGADEPWSPPDRHPRGAELAELDEESLSVRLRQEESDPADLAEHEQMLGGDDPDAIPAGEDVLGGEASGEDDSVDLEGERGPEADAMHLDG